jgi:hypothetical protein
VLFSSTPGDGHMPPMLPPATALHDDDDITVAVAPELTSRIAPNWIICTRRPACSVHQSAARIRQGAPRWGSGEPE